jgi:hypothetical protein
MVRLSATCESVVLKSLPENLHPRVTSARTTACEHRGRHPRWVSNARGHRYFVRGQLRTGDTHAGGHRGGHVQRGAGGRRRDAGSIGAVSRDGGADWGAKAVRPSAAQGHRRAAKRVIVEAPAPPHPAVSAVKSRYHRSARVAQLRNAPLAAVQAQRVRHSLMYLKDDRHCKATSPTARRSAVCTLPASIAPICLLGSHNPVTVHAPRRGG